MDSKPIYNDIITSLKGANRWYMGFFADSLTLMRNELTHLSTDEFLAVVEALGFFDYLRGAAKSATDIEVANGARTDINKFLKKNGLLNNSKKNQEFMGRTSFIAMLLAPTTETHTDLEGWMSTVIANIDTHIKSLNGERKTKANLASINGARQAQDLMKKLRYDYKGKVDISQAEILKDIRKKYPKELGLIERTSGMHQIHSEQLLNYKRKVGDSDLYESPFFNARRYGNVGESSVEITDENDSYAQMSSSTASLQDRNQSSMSKGQYLITPTFVDIQQRAYNQSSRMMFTGASIRQMNYATKTGEFKNIVGETGRDAIRTKLRNMVNAVNASETPTLEKSGAKAFKKGWRWLNRFKNQNLITLKQPFVQASVVSYTAATAPVASVKTMREMGDKDNVWAMMNILAEESSLGSRSVSYMISSATSDKQNARDVLLGNPPTWLGKVLLNSPDYMVATYSWLTFYRQKRMEQLGGAEFSWEQEAKSPNRTASNYAEFMQQASQASNVKEAGSSFSTSGSEVGQLFRETFVPFSYFTHSFATNMMTDVGVAMKGDTDAIKRLGGYNTVPLAYGAVKWGARIGVGNLVLSALTKLIDDEEEERKDEEGEYNELESAISIYAKGTKSGLEESLEKIEGLEGFLEVIGTQWVGDMVFAGVLVDDFKRPMIDNLVNGLDYKLGEGEMAQTSKKAGEYSVDVANDLLYFTLGEFLDSDGKILDVYRGRKNWEYIAPSIVNAVKGIGALATADDGYIEAEGKKVDLTDKQIEVMRVSGWADILSGIIPLQEFAQIQNIARRTNEKMLNNTWFDELSKKGKLHSPTNQDLVKSWETESFLKSGPDKFSQKNIDLLEESYKNEDRPSGSIQFEKLAKKVIGTASKFDKGMFYNGLNNTQIREEYKQLEDIREVLREAKKEIEK
ncbi:MAG TPA: hypothetical protein ENG81_00085 [Candidatus Bathyarchaeota archaeon]|nr:hypothetical protein [Candidatus Bathyarchaeota archaeon]